MGALDPPPPPHQAVVACSDLGNPPPARRQRCIQVQYRDAAVANHRHGAQGPDRSQGCHRRCSHRGCYGHRCKAELSALEPSSSTFGADCSRGRMHRYMLSNDVEDRHYSMVSHTFDCMHACLHVRVYVLQWTKSRTSSCAWPSSNLPDSVAPMTSSSSRLASITYLARTARSRSVRCTTPICDMREWFSFLLLVLLAWCVGLENRGVGP